MSILAELFLIVTYAAHCNPDAELARHQQNRNTATPASRSANAKRTAVVGEHGERLKVVLSAPPVDGKANAALVKFFAKSLGLSKSQLLITAGEGSREKRLEVVGLSETELLAAIKDLAA